MDCGMSSIPILAPYTKNINYINRNVEVTLAALSLCWEKLPSRSNCSSACSFCRSVFRWSSVCSILVNISLRGRTGLIFCSRAFLRSSALLVVTTPNYQCHTHTHMWILITIIWWLSFYSNHQQLLTSRKWYVLSNMEDIMQWFSYSI